MKKKSLFVLMMASLLAGCSKSEVEIPGVGGEAQEIVLQSSVLDVNVSSRAPYEGANLATQPLEALVVSRESTNTYSTLHGYGEIRFDGSTTGTAYTKPMYAGSYVYPVNSVYLTGLYPLNVIGVNGNATGWNGFTGTSTTNGQIKFDINGFEDIMFAAEQITSASAVASSQYATLQFKHQLTLMKFFLYGDQQARTEGVKVVSIELVKVNGDSIPSVVDIDLNANPQTVGFAVASTPVASLPCYFTGTDNVFSYTLNDPELAIVPEAIPADPNAYILAPPVMPSNLVTAKEYTFKVKYIDNRNSATPKERLVNVDLVDGSGILLNYANRTTKGEAFNLQFQFIGNQIVANASITDWTLISTINQEI